MSDFTQARELEEIKLSWPKLSEDMRAAVLAVVRCGSPHPPALSMVPMVGAEPGHYAKTREALAKYPAKLAAKRHRQELKAARQKRAMAST